MSISNDGIALAESSKSDLNIMFLRILTEAISYAKDGEDIMIANRWLEQTPQAYNHENLAVV